MKFLRQHSMKLVAGLVLVALAGWLFLHRAEISRDSVIAYGKGLPAFAFIAAFLVLPLLGFPTTVFLVLAGIRFGLAGGMAISAVAIVGHHLAAYPLARKWFHDPLQDRLVKWGHKIPAVKDRGQVGFTAIFAAIHGPPYFVKLYLLALTNIPFRIYLGVGAPIYILFGLIPVGAGSSVRTVNPVWIFAALGALTAASLLGYVLKKRFKNPPD